MPTTKPKITAVKIERGIPIPEFRRGNPKGPLRLAMEAMKPGDSIQIPRKAKPANELYNMAGHIGIKIATRQTNCASRRIWRVS